MVMNKLTLSLTGIAVILIATMGFVPSKPKPTPTIVATKIVLTRTPTRTAIPPTSTPIPSTATPIPATSTQIPPTATPTAIPATLTPGAPIEPYPSASACQDLPNNQFHTIWDSELGCHYDHEHGTNPFVPEIEQAFPGFNLFELLGNVEIGHTNPSGPMENTHKHAGFKWQIDTSAPTGCQEGFEGGTVAVDAYAIQYHAFGPQSMEFETRNHSTASLLRQCQSGNPQDKGYIYTVSLQEYGERCLPYQGQTLVYPDNFQPQYNCAFGPYFTTEGVPLVRPSLSYYSGFYNRNNLSIWTSKPTGIGARPETNRTFRLLFRIRDVTEVMDSNDLEYPFTWLKVCTNDGGLTYFAPGCRYNNSTTTIHEIAGDIPASWDNLAGFDTDLRVGRITAEGYTTRFGVLSPSCTQIGFDCHPIKMVAAFVGRYSSEISIIKVSNPTPLDTPERDIYFCGSVVCAETDEGAVPSGWISLNN